MPFKDNNNSIIEIFHTNSIAFEIVPRMDPYNYRPQMNLVDEVYDDRTNIGRIRKNFHVTIEMKDGNVYDIYFRNAGGYNEVPEQSAVLKYHFINETLGCLPSLVDNQLLYINLDTGDVVLKDHYRNERQPYYPGFDLVSYDMFDGAKWAGCFKNPPSE